MTLKVNGEQYTKSSMANMRQVCLAIMTLPPPDIMPVKKGEKYDPTRLLITRQAEYAHVSLKDTGGEIDEIGTTDLSQCLALYIFTKNDHFIIHVDTDLRKLDLDAILSRFENTNNIKAMVFGGRADTKSDSKESEANLAYICSLLMSSTYNIELIAQKVMGNNISTIDSEKLKIKDVIIPKIMYLYYHLFGCELHQEEYMRYMSSDFESTDTQIDTETLGNFIAALCDTRVLQNDATRKVIELLHENNINKKFFRDLCVGLFSKQGYETLQQLVDTTELRTGPLMRHFTINMRTQVIRLISKQTPIPFENHRIASLLDAISVPLYSEAYSLNHYNIPTLGSRYQMIHNLTDIHIKLNKTTDTRLNHIQKLVGDPNPPNYTDKVIHSCRKLNAALQFPLLISFNAPVPRKIEKEISSNVSLDYLNELSYKKEMFTAQERDYPKGVIDAVSPILKPMEAIHLQHHLANHSIDSEIRKDSEGNFRLCVFNINENVKVKNKW